MFLRGLKIAGLVVLILLATVAVITAILWHTQNAAVAGKLGNLAQKYLIANDSTKIEFSRVSGNPLGSLTLQNVRLSVRDGVSWKNFFVARRIRIGYSASELARKKLAFNYVELEEPVLSLAKGARENYLWPHFGKGGKGKGKEFEIRTLVLTNGKLSIGKDGGKGIINEIQMRGSLKSGTGGLALNGLNVSFVASTWKYRVDSCRGNLLFREGKMFVDSLVVHTARSKYSLDGYAALSGSREIKIAALIDTLSLAELRGVKRLSFLPAEGELSGSVDISKKTRGLTEISSVLSGTYGTHTIDSLEVVTVMEKGKWENQFRMESQGSVIEGTFNVGPGTFQECAVDFVRFDPRVWPEIFGKTVIPAGSLNGAFRFSGASLTSAERNGEIQVSFDGGTYAGVTFLEGKAEGRFDGEGRLVFSRIDFRGSGYSANASGIIGPEGMIDLVFDASVAKLGEFPHLNGKFDIDSDMAAIGRLRSTGKKLTIETDLTGKLRRTSPLTVSGVVTNGRVEGELWPSLSLNARVLLNSGELRGIVFDSLSVQTLIKKTEGGSGFRDQEEKEGAEWCAPLVAVVTGSARIVRKDTVVTAEGIVDCCKNGVDIRVEKVAAHLGEFDWENGRAIRLGWREGALEIRDLVLSSGQSQIEFTGTYGSAGKRSGGTLNVRSLDVHKALGRLVPVAGIVDAEVSFEQADGQFSSDGRVSWSNASFRDRGLDRLSFSASVRNKEVQVKELELAQAQGRITVAGELQLPANLGEFVDSVRRAHSIPRGVQAKLDVSTAGLNLSEFSKWHPVLATLGGIIDTKVRIEGLIENPQMTIDLSAKDLRIKQYRVAGVELRATLKDSVCSISRLGLMEKNAKGEVVGFFPVALNLGRGRLDFPDNSLNLNVKLSESDFSLVTLFVRQIASASGLMKGEAQFSGTFRNLALSGGFDIANGSLRFAGREEVLDNLNAQVSLNEKVIELVRFTATQGEDGRLEGSGRILLSQGERGRYSFAIKGKKVTFGDAEDIALKFDCDLAISTVEVRDRGTYPKITGRIDVEQGIIAREFQTAQGPQKEQRWLCDVEVEVPNNLWLKNINAEIELAGSITARKDVSGLVLLGSLTILRGKYYVFDNEFSISSGTLEFKDVGQINPEMNIQAETRVSGRRVFLVLTGKLSEPNIALSSEDANLSQTDVLRLLTVGKYAAAESGQTGDSGVMPGVTGSVGNYFLRQVERRLARELKWVDSIELGSGLEGAGSFSELRWGLGKYITPELYLRYSQGLTRTSERDVSVEYRLSELLFLRGGVTSRDRFTGREKDEYNLDLRLKYEY